MADPMAALRRLWPFVWPPSVRRRALLVTAASFLAWTAWYLAAIPGPAADLSRGHFSDHFSHMNAARFFTHVGMGKWKHSMAESLRRLTPAERAALPPDERTILAGGDEAYEIPGFPEDKPIIASWSGLPHFYPPGDLVLVAPVAVLYHFTSMRLGTACRLLILLFLAFAHGALFFLFEDWLSADQVVSPVGFAGLFVGYSELIHWSLEGFYDAAMLVPLIVCTRYLRQRRGLAAGVAYCAAAFIHYRAFFFAPLALYAAYLLVRNREWREWRRPHFIAIGVAAVLGGSSLWTFFTVLPRITGVATNNPIFIGTGPITHTTWAFLAVALVVGLALARARAWLDVAILGWLTVMLVRMNSTYEWYMLVLIAWLGLDVLSRPTLTSIAREARVIYVVTASMFAFRYTPLPTWLVRLF